MNTKIKRILTLTFWALGSSGAVLFACFWVFGMIYTRKFRFSVLAIVGFGVYLAWQGVKMFRQEQRSLH
jgi:threonine/homoserine/homoserine lactone efflux protein